jgi:hypothetical protein
MSRNVAREMLYIPASMGKILHAKLTTEDWSPTAKELVMKCAMVRVLVEKEKREDGKQTQEHERDKHADCGVSKERL